MPITIQELLASDTISQAVDKINFNFDQLILNGGGPVGPAGVAGPTGPIGGRGIRGEKWYEDPNVTATDPNTLIFTDLIEGDNYLDANGVVWKYNGTSWVITPVDLTGPTGPAGSADGFLFFGGFPGGAPAGNENVAYPTLMPSGTAGGANSTNEAVPSLIIAGIPQNAPATSGITYTDAYQISTAMMEDLDSSVVSTIIHQKDSGTSAIKFMGGGALLSENFEQDDVTQLSGIKLTEDDTLNIIVPKPATSPTVISDLIGFNLNTSRRGQQFRAGKQIDIISGVDSTPSGLVSEHSDITFTVNTANPATPAKLSMASTNTASTALFELGGNISSPTTTTNTGRIYGAADNVRFVGGTEVGMRIGNNFMIVEPSNITIESALGDVQINTNNNDFIVQAGSSGTLDLNGFSISGSAADDVTFSAPDIDLIGPDIKLKAQSGTHQLFVDNSSITTGGIKLTGNVVWDYSGVGSPSPYTSTRQILIRPQNTTNPPLIIQSFSGDGGTLKGIRIATGTGTGVFVNSTEIYNAGVYIDGNSAATGIIGFRLNAEDSVSSRNHTQFHAKRDTTEIGNRLRYVRRSVNVNPCTAGITGGSGGTGYTVPAAAMDATYLDIQFAYPGGPTSPSPAASDDEFDFYLPDGAYEGQKLVLHITAAPSRNLLNDGFGYSYYDWPSASGSGGEITIYVKSSSNGYSTTYEQIAQMEVGKVGSSPRNGSEFLAEFIWSGRTYTAVEDSIGGSTIRRRTMGWIMVSGPGVVSATAGQYKAVENTQQYS